MTKVSTYHCDFNPNVPPHQAQFRIFGKQVRTATVSNNPPSTPDDKDACGEHVLQMAASVLNRGGEVCVKAITEGGVVVPHVEYEPAGKAGGGGKNKAPSALMRADCPEDGCDATGLTYSGLTGHLMGVHSWEKELAAEARNEALEEWKRINGRSILR